MDYNRNNNYEMSYMNPATGQPGMVHVVLIIKKIFISALGLKFLNFQLIHQRVLKQTTVFNTITLHLEEIPRNTKM